MTEAALDTKREAPMTCEEAHCLMDELEVRMLAEMAKATGARLDPIEMQLVHRWTPGLYVREIVMPAGAIVTSKIHKTEHPFVVLSGVAEVFSPEGGVEIIRAGHVGITKPGTRRVLVIHEETRWLTFHPITEEEQGDLAAIEERIIEQRALPGGSERTAFSRYRELLDTQAKELPGQLDYGGAP